MPNNPFIVAEISSNHLGDLHRAMDLILAAKNAGADAVKFQTYELDGIAADVMIESGPWAGQSYRGLYAEGRTSWDWHRKLFEFARNIGIVPFASPFSVEAVEFLEKLDCPIYKIDSPEIVHYPLIAAAAQTGRPLIISTGMATLGEIYEADDIARANGATDITFLHCLSSYPADPADFNLQTMVRLKHYNFHIGLSDHSLDNTAAIAAVALGAIVIEKHLTLSRADGGSDAKFSLEPDEFAAMVQACRAAAKAMGTVQFGCRESEKTSFQYRRSIWVVKDVKEGQVITADDIAVLRPNYGVAPCYWDKIVGSTAKYDLAANSPMLLEYLE
jgi:N-acetylneuraminate synthase